MHFLCYGIIDVLLRKIWCFKVKDHNQIGHLLQGNLENAFDEKISHKFYPL